jgi:hypothetical protein
VPKRCLRGPSIGASRLPTEPADTLTRWGGWDADTLWPTSKIKPHISYDPSPNDRTSYSAVIDIEDTYGQKEYDEPLKTHYRLPHHVRRSHPSLP